MANDDTAPGTEISTEGTRSSAIPGPRTSATSTIHAAAPTDEDEDASKVDSKTDAANLTRSQLIRRITWALVSFALAVVTAVVNHSNDTKSVPLLFAALGLAIIAGIVVLLIFFPAAPHAFTTAVRRSRRRHRRLVLTAPEASPRIQRYANRIIDEYKQGNGQRQWTISAPDLYGKGDVLGVIRKRFSRQGAIVIFIAVPEGLDEAQSRKAFVECMADDLHLYPALLQQLQDAARASDTSPDLLRDRVVTAIRDSDREVLILVRDLHKLNSPAAGAAARWVVDLCRAASSGGRRLAVLIESESSPIPPFGQRLEMKSLTPADLATEVARVGVPRRRRSEAEAALLRYSDGQPPLVAEGCQIIRTDGLSALAQRAVPDAGTATEASSTNRLAMLDRQAGVIAHRRRNSKPLAVSDWLAALARFGDAYLPTILEEILREHEGLSRAAADRVVAWLRTRTDLIISLDDDPESGLQLKTSIRALHLDDLAVRRPGRLEQIHRVIEAKYWACIDSEPDALPQVRLSLMQTRFESLDWHLFTLEWLEHAKQSGAENISTVRDHCIQLFFVRYWWWDVYVRSGYCTSLIDEYRKRWPDAEWVHDLDTFRDNYVSGPRLPGWSTSEDRPEIALWNRADGALMRLLTTLGLTDRGAKVARHRRKLATHIWLMRADTTCFLELFEDSRDWLAAVRTVNDEDWMEPWIDFTEAEVLTAMGRFDDAPPLLEGLEGKTIEFDDGDLRIRLIMLLAELAWQKNQLHECIALYTHGLLLACVYHLQQECDAEREWSSPNDYSQLLHQEVGDRLSARLAEVSGLVGESEADRMRAQVQTFFAPYWSFVRKEHGTEWGLFPPPPAMTDLDTANSSYWHDMNWLRRAMKRQLAEASDTLL